MEMGKERHWLRIEFSLLTEWLATAFDIAGGCGCIPLMSQAVLVPNCPTSPWESFHLSYQTSHYGDGVVFQDVLLHLLMDLCTGIVMLATLLQFMVIIIFNY